MVNDEGVKESTLRLQLQQQKTPVKKNTLAEINNPKS
jgi:hypothetical protein